MDAIIQGRSSPPYHTLCTLASSSAHHARYRSRWCCLVRWSSAGRAAAGHGQGRPHGPSFAREAELYRATAGSAVSARGHGASGRRRRREEAERRDKGQAEGGGGGGGGEGEGGLAHEVREKVKQKEEEERRSGESKGRSKTARAASCALVCPCAPTPECTSVHAFVHSRRGERWKGQRRARAFNYVHQRRNCKRAPVYMR